MPIRKCSYCDSRFSKVEHLKRHERSHTGEKPYECRKCHKRFSRGDVLNRHLKGHYEHNGSINTAAIATPPPLQDDQNENSSPKPSGLEQQSPSHPSRPPSPSQSIDVVPLGGSGSRSSRPAREVSLDIKPILQQASITLSPDPSRTDRPNSTPTSHENQVPSAPNQASSSPISEQEAEELRSMLRPSYQMAVLPEDAVLGDEDGFHAFGAPVSNQDFDQFLSVYSGRDDDHTESIEPNWMSGLDADIVMSGGNNGDWSNSLLVSPHAMSIMPVLDKPRRSSSFSIDIPDQRFAKMARLWPKKSGRPWKLMHTLWADADAHGGSNVFSDAAAERLLNPPKSRSQPVHYGIDDERRLEMMKEYAVGGFTGEPISKDLCFPSADTLGLCIDVYFTRFHRLKTIIHEPTFSPKLAPNILLFPICLLGLLLVDPERSRGFIEIHLSHAIQKCTAALSKPWSKHEPMSLLTVFASAVLLLMCSVIMEDRITYEDTYTLYSKALSFAQQNSLFECDKGPPLDLSNYHERGDDDSWKSWARVESAKRVIASLIMIDSYFAFTMGASPITRVDTLQFYVPCSSALFAAYGAKEWVQLTGRESMASQIIDFRPGQMILPVGLPSSSIAMHALLSALWLRFADLRHRLILNRRGAKDAVLFPGKSFQEDTTGAVLVPLLQQIYISYQHDLVRENPNVMVFWHNMHITLTANVEIFERAAGREGIEAAKLALESIQTWAQIPCARRACLHAAQVYANMSRRKVADGTMFVSESAVFNSALVLGLYLYVEPSSLYQSTRVLPSSSSFELLDDVDWSEIGDAGLPGQRRSPNGSTSAAMRFINEGGPVSFAGKSQQGGYGSARRVILEYVSLLEEVGKWNSTELCRILRIMSDVSEGPEKW